MAGEQTTVGSMAQWPEDAARADVPGADEHITHQDLAKMYSGDWEVPMTRVRRSLRDEYEDWQTGEAWEKPHGKDIEHGGPDAYVNYLSNDMRITGMHTPIDVRDGRVVVDGNHRGVAAMQLGLDRIPIRHVPVTPALPQ